MIDSCPDNMQRLIVVDFAVDRDGDDYHIRNSTVIPDGITWQEAYAAMLQIRDDIQRQIDEKFNCPFHPKNVKVDGLPVFEPT